MDIIKFGYDREYVVDSRFNLNDLRFMLKAKKVGKTYIPDNSDSGIEISIGINYSCNEDKNTQLELTEAIKEKDQYSKWWSEAKAEYRKVKEELDCIKKTMKAIKEEGNE